MYKISHKWWREEQSIKNDVFPIINDNRWSESVDVQHLKENVKLNENKIISLIAVRFIYDFLFLFKMLTDLEEPDEDESVDACPLLTVNACFAVLFSLSETSLEGSTVTS